MGSIANKLNKLIDTKSELETTIRNSGSQMYFDDRFSDYATRVNQILWQPEPDWFNIRQIFKDDPNPNKRAIYLFSNSDVTTTLNNAELGNASATYKTSDGTTYNDGDNYEHTWNASFDSAKCKYGYRTRWIMVYSDDININCDVALQNILFVYVGNKSNIVNLRGSHYVNSLTSNYVNTILTAVECENDTTGDWGILPTIDRHFTWCCGLNYIKIPNNMSYFPKACFNNCHGLRMIDFQGDSILNDIDNIQIFTACSSLRNMTLPDIKNMWQYGVLGNTLNVIIDNSRTIINSGEAFRSEGNSMLQTVTFKGSFDPTSVTSLAYIGDESLIAINIDMGVIPPSINVTSKYMSVSGMETFLSNAGQLPAGTTRKIAFGSSNISKVDIAYIALATNKGYTIVL